jgi:alpha-L-arabinofuranosidase
MKAPLFLGFLMLAHGLAFDFEASASQTLGSPVNVAVGQSGKPISPDLVGIFFEDLNDAADGGLYAELVQNRSFEYQATEQGSWNNFTSWEFTARGSGKGSWAIADALPLNANNPHYLEVEIHAPGDGVGVVNSGFDGIPIQAGEKYNVSLFARVLYAGPRGSKADKLQLTVRLEGKNNEVLGETAFNLTAQEWQRFSAQITANQSEPAAHLVVLAKGMGRIALDEISLFPEKTFRGHPNGLRADLAQAIADLKPKFMRFPGGCLVHGNGLGNIYRWKDTIGPVEQRRQQANIWGYHQTVGLGYYEYFQFCEDIGAKPLPVVAAGVCCQNSGHTRGTGQQGLPMEEMPAYVQDVLDLIEWANGPATSKWGAKRAGAGHPKPFHLEYLGIGNEDHITPVFKERFQMIFDAVKKQHPEITVVGTVGPDYKGEDYEKGWKIANELHVPVVDEHYYRPYQWFWDNRHRYDSYNRGKTQVYLGEYAAYDDKRRNTLRAALAEAAYLTSLERNGDVVRMTSYAPLLGKLGHIQWSPNMIHFTNTEVGLTPSYYVQQMFSTNSGDTYQPVSINDPGQKTGAAGLAASCARDSATGDVILKLVNGDTEAHMLRIALPGSWKLAHEAVKTVLAGDLAKTNEPGEPQPVLPVKSTIPSSSAFNCEAPASSLTVIRIPSESPRR